MGPEVWPRDRQRDPPTPATGRRQVAPRRDGRDDRGQEALPVARGRSGRLCARGPDPEPTRQEGGQAAAAQAPEEAGSGAACHGDRQAALLRRGEEGDHAGGRASPAQRAQQPTHTSQPADENAR